MQPEDSSIQPDRSPILPVFLRVFFALILFSVAVGVLVSYAFPPTYEVTASIHVTPATPSNDYEAFHRSLISAFEFVNSDAIWRETSANATFTTERTLEEMRKHLKIWPGRGSSRFDIAAEAHHPSEATGWVKSMAETVIRLTAKHPQFSELHLRLEGPHEPTLISPTKAQIAGWGALIGIALGALGGGTIVCLRRRIEDRAIGK